ncbi:hypothetical protein F2P79_007101 [Pimephales promelas]|nr:hypothetical protein F2P79_007101 [Pimephales promelas]
MTKKLQKADILNINTEYSSEIWSQLAIDVFNEDSHKNRHWLWVVWNHNRRGLRKRVHLAAKSPHHHNGTEEIRPADKDTEVADVETQCETEILERETNFDFRQPIYQEPDTDSANLKSTPEPTKVQEREPGRNVQRQCPERGIGILVHHLQSKSPVSLSLDVAGGVVSKIPEQPKRVLYYALALPGKARDAPPLPVCEMLSNDHSVPPITFWLSEFTFHLSKYTQGKVHQVETDYSWALIQSVMLAFNKEHISSYLNRAYEFCTGKKSWDEMKSYTVLHICSAHILKAVRQAISRETDDKGLRDFATYAFARLQNASSMTESRTVFRAFCALLTTPQNTNLVKESLCVLESVISRSREHRLEDTTQSEDWESKERRHAMTIIGRSPFSACFQQIVKEVKEEVAGDEKCLAKEDNPYFCPGILTVLHTYLAIFPLWSGLLLGESRQQELVATLKLPKTRETDCPKERACLFPRKRTEGSTKMWQKVRNGQFLNQLLFLKGKLSTKMWQKARDGQFLNQLLFLKGKEGSTKKLWQKSRFLNQLLFLKGKVGSTKMCQKARKGQFLNQLLFLKGKVSTKMWQKARNGQFLNQLLFLKGKVSTKMWQKAKDGQFLNQLLFLKGKVSTKMWQKARNGQFLNQLLFLKGKVSTKKCQKARNGQFLNQLLFLKGKVSTKKCQKVRNGQFLNQLLFLKGKALLVDEEIDILWTKPPNDLVVAVVKSDTQNQEFLLHHREFLTLRPHAWIFGETIECYLRAVLNAKGANLYQLSHYTTGVILNDTKDRVIRQGLKKVNFERYDGLISVVNTTHMHWRFVYLHATTNTIFILDPQCGNNEMEFATQACTKFGEYFRMRGNLYGRKDWVDTVWKPGTINHSFQEDGFNCAVFVMQMAKQVLEHFPKIPESIDITPNREEMCHTRKNVAKVILQASVSSEEYCSVCGQKDTKTNGKKDQKEELCTWVQCELCQRWFHVQCLKTNLPPEEEPWVCGLCL